MSYRQVRRMSTFALKNKLEERVNMLLATWDECIDDSMAILANRAIRDVTTCQTQEQYAEETVLVGVMLTELRIRGEEDSHLEEVFEAFLWQDPPPELKSGAKLYAIK
jgi:hypothetical protein